MNQAMTSPMTSAPSDGRPSGSPILLARFRAWLVRAQPGDQLEYHRGLLIWDRSPASDLAEDGRRVVAKVADAALQASEDGLVHLVQRRQGPFDFSYVAIKAGRCRSERRAAVLIVDRAGAQHPVPCLEAA